MSVNAEHPENWRVILRQEFGAAEGSFLIKMRIDFEWDKEAFSRLTRAMAACCRDSASDEKLERWLAEGFWYLTSSVKDWMDDPKFPHVHSPEYYRVARERLEILGYWYFTGDYPYKEGTGFEPI